MPSTLLEDSIIIALEDQETCPQPITLFQTYPVEQMLLADSANSMAVQTFLKMCSLEFQVETRSNAEYMSPSGRVPFIKCGAFYVSEFDNIVSFIATKGKSLSDQLPPTCKADMRAYISLVNNIFVNAELYICWVDKTTLTEVTEIRHGCAHPWPLNHILNWQKKKDVTKKLSVLGWYNKTIEEVCMDVDNCCTALSERLEGNDYFCGDKTPNELDALVFGHIFTIITTPLPGEILANIVQKYPLLINHCKRIETRYFERPKD